MSKQIYEVWFVEEVGRVFVEAEDKDEALRRAENASGEYYDEIDTCNCFANTAEVADPYTVYHSCMPVYKET